MNQKQIKFLVLSFLFFISSILSLTFVSFRYQRLINRDIKSKQFLLSPDDLKYMPTIPNIGVTTLPVSALKAPYYINKDPKTAYDLLTIGTKVNPYIYYSEYLLGSYFLQSKDFDSAYHYSKKAFYNWPKNIDHYKLYNNVLVAKKDTLEILNAYSYINDRFISKDLYYESFIDSYSNAKLRFLVFQYPDLRSVQLNDLKGRWKQVYEFETGEINYLQNEIEFSEIEFINQNSKYNYHLLNDTLFLKFKTNNKVISKIPIFYSDSLNTLVLKNIPTSVIDDLPNAQDQFFKKID